MEKLKIGIIAIFVIFLVGGCYAVYQGNDLDSNATTDISSSSNISNVSNNDVNNQSNNLQNDNINTARDISQNNNINNFASALENNYRKIPGADVLVNKDIDYTDMYLQCVACGGFIALGEVTKPLPEDALCPNLCEGHSINDNTDYAVTYDFAKAFYDQYGRHPEVVVYDTWEPVPNSVDNLVLYPIDMPTDSGVVYDTWEPVPNSVDNLVLYPIDMPTDSGVVYDTWESVPNSVDSLVLNDISDRNIEQ